MCWSNINGEGDWEGCSAVLEKVKVFVDLLSKMWLVKIFIVDLLSQRLKDFDQTIHLQVVGIDR